MKTLLTLLFAGWFIVGEGQQYIQPRAVQVSHTMTTNLVFPSPIVSVDRGSERIIVQKSTDNILRVKADTVFADTTNLTVITTDGKLYSFLVSYQANPVYLNIDLRLQEATGTDTALLSLAEKVAQYKNCLRGIRFSSGKIQASVTGIYSTGKSIVCKLRIENRSAFSFVAGRLRCYASGSHSARRRPSQTLEVVPMFLYPSEAVIKERQSVNQIVILPKAALGDGQQLQISLREKDADRILLINIPNKHILHALLIQ